MAPSQLWQPPWAGGGGWCCSELQGAGKGRDGMLTVLLAGTCRARPLRVVGMGPPHLPKTFLHATCSALGEAERDFQERGGSPSSAQLVIPPAKNAARLCSSPRCALCSHPASPGQPAPCELLPCSPLLGLPPCPAGPAWSPSCPQGPVGTDPGCAGGSAGLGTSPQQWLQVPRAPCQVLLPTNLCVGCGSAALAMWDQRLLTKRRGFGADI